MHDDQTGTTKFVSREVLLSMSGLDFMLGMLEGRLPRPAISVGLNYRLTRVEDGCVAFTGAPLLAHCNPMGGVHGGWYGTILDSALGCAVMTRVDKGRFYTTLEYKVNISRAIPVDTEVEALAEIQHAGRSTATANAWIRGTADGKLYATGSTTCLIMDG